MERRSKHGLGAALAASCVLGLVGGGTAHGTDDDLRRDAVFTMSNDCRAATTWWRSGAGANVGRGASDISLSRDSAYLYQLNAFDGRINAFRVGRDGDLTLVRTVDATGPSMMAGRIGIAAS